MLIHSIIIIAIVVLWQCYDDGEKKCFFFDFFDFFEFFEFFDFFELFAIAENR